MKIMSATLIGDTIPLKHPPSMGASCAPTISGSAMGLYAVIYAEKFWSRKIRKVLVRITRRRIDRNIGSTPK